VTRNLRSEKLRLVIQEQGYWYRDQSSFDDFFTAMVEAGGWWDPDSAIPAFRRLYSTPTGRYELSSTQLREAGAAAGDRAANGLPEYREQRPAVAAGAEADYPYQLSTFYLLTSLERHGVNVPILQEMPSPRFEDNAWLPWIEVDPRLAARLGIADGDPVQLISPKGRVETRARLVAGRFEDVIHAPVAMGHASTTRWTERDEAEPSRALVDVADGLKGIGVASATAVRLERA
jgi:anaerobic selenocysteine-containing dehydrogenase